MNICQLIAPYFVCFFLEILHELYRAPVARRKAMRYSKKIVTLSIRIDTGICAVMDYFEIFLQRMTLCRSAAAFLGLTFELVINETRML